jgi:hypothetical protein
MKKTLFIIAAMVLLSAPFLSMVSDQSDAEVFKKDKALVPDIYKIELGTGTGYPSYYTSYRGSGWTDIYVFVEGSSNESKFLNTIKNKQNLPFFEDDYWKPGKKVMYILSAAFNLELFYYDWEAEVYRVPVSLEGKLIYKSETTHYLKSGQSVNIAVEGSSSAKLSSTSYSFQIESGPILIPGSTNYMLHTSSTSEIFLSYTIEYDTDFEENDNTALAMACIGLGALGIVSMIWFGRKQKIS